MKSSVLTVLLVLVFHGLAHGQVTFNYSINDARGFYDPVDGTGSVRVTANMVENEDSDDYPNETEAFQGRFTYDTDLLELVEARFIGEVDEIPYTGKAVTISEGGVTFFIKYNVILQTTFVFDEEQEFMELIFDTVPDAFIDDDLGLTTDITSETFGMPEVTNYVQCNDCGLDNVEFEPGTVRFSPGADCNPDEEEMDEGSIEDCNEDGEPDECVTERPLSEGLGGASEARYGAAVSTDDGVLFVGAPEDDGGTSSVRMLEWDAETRRWIEMRTLTPSDPGSNTSFGCAVAVCGTLAVIGAERTDDPTNSGSAYVFRYDDAEGGWFEEAKLTASDAAFNDRFGFAVATDGVRVVVGAPRVDGLESNSGNAYVFDYDESLEEWGETTLGPADGGEDDAFGTAVAIEGDRILVGAPGHDETGSVHEFRFDADGEAWVDEPVIGHSEIVSGDEFGAAIALYGDVAWVGAPSHDTPAFPGSGAAYVLRFDGEVWDEEESHFIDVGDDLSVALHEHRAVVGIPGSSLARLYVHDGESWASDSADFRRGSTASVDFGTVVAISGPTIVIGDPGFADDTGRVHVLTDLDCDDNDIPDDCDMEEGRLTDADGDGLPESCVPDPPVFERGDANGDGDVEPLVDGLYMLEHAFTGGPAVLCLDAGDADDDGEYFLLLEALYLFDWGFLGGDIPPDPGPEECGPDPTADGLGCDEIPAGCP